MSSICDEFVRLADAGIGDGRFGFSWFARYGQRERRDGRIGDLGSPVGAPIRCDAAPEGRWLRTCEIEWAGGLRFEGWVAQDIDEDIEILIAQRPLMTVKPTGWTNVERGGEVGVGRRIDFNLPEHLADGRVRGLTADHPDAVCVEPIAPSRSIAIEQTIADLGR